MTGLEDASSLRHLHMLDGRAIDGLNGILIVLEGLDNVGKTTLSISLARILERNGLSPCIFSFPGREPGSLGELVYNIHHKPDLYLDREFDPESLQLMHVAAHIDALKHDILPALRCGKSVILDRSWWSTYAYGLAEGLSHERMMEIVSSEMLYWQSVPASKVFLIQRQGSNPGYDPQKTRKLKRAYDDLLSNDKTARVIDNDGPIEMVATKIYDCCLVENEA